MGINMMHKFLKEKTKLRNKFKHITLCADMSLEDKMFLHSYYLTKWRLVVCQVPKNIQVLYGNYKEKDKDAYNNRINGGGSQKHQNQIYTPLIILNVLLILNFI